MLGEPLPGRRQVSPAHLADRDELLHGLGDAAATELALTGRAIAVQLQLKTGE